MIGSGVISGYIGGKVGNNATDETKQVLELINEMTPEDQYVKEPYASQEFHTL